MLDRVGVLDRQPTVREAGADELYLRAWKRAQAGDIKVTERAFADVASSTPSLVPALEAHGEALDMMGECERAQERYDFARKIRSQARRAPPDRPLVLRNRRSFVAEIAAYTAMLGMGPAKRLPLTYLARGNAYLATGYARLALIDYGLVLRLDPKLSEVMALKGHAWTMLASYENALRAFNKAITGQPNNPNAYGGRAIALMASGKLPEADASWSHQLNLLPQDQRSARACILLRVADYAAALPDLEHALKKEPSDPYWHLYRLTALRRLGHGASCQPMDFVSSGSWPAPLFALHAGRACVDEVLDGADNEDRRAEALFQIGVVVYATDPLEARNKWHEVVQNSSPTLIEHAAARHELAQFAA